MSIDCGFGDFGNFGDFFFFLSLSFHFLNLFDLGEYESISQKKRSPFLNFFSFFLFSFSLSFHRFRLFGAEFDEEENGNILNVISLKS